MSLLKEFLEGQFYSVVKNLFRVLEDLSMLIRLFDSAVKIADKIDNYDIEFRRRNLVTFSLTPPNLKLGVSWRAGVNEGKAGFVVEGMGEGNIITLKVSFDLFCLASKMPSLKVGILALELIEWATDIKFVFCLDIEGALKFEGKLGYDEAQDAFGSELKIGGKLEVTINLSVKVEPRKNYKAVTKDGKEYGVKGTTGITCDFMIKLEKEDDDEYGLFSDMESNFCALEIIFYSKTTIKREGDITASDDEGIIENEHVQTIKNITLIESFEIGKTDKTRII
jgi:hypothetical protein